MQQGSAARKVVVVQQTPGALLVHSTPEEPSGEYGGQWCPQMALGCNQGLIRQQGVLAEVGP